MNKKQALFVAVVVALSGGLPLVFIPALRFTLLLAYGFTVLVILACIAVSWAYEKLGD